MNSKWLLVVFALMLGTQVSQAQINVRTYKPNGLKQGNFGKYPSRVRIAPMVSFGSCQVNYEKNETPIRDTAFIQYAGKNILYNTWGAGFKNGSQFNFGLMFDVPFGKHIVFRPFIAYNSKSAKNVTDYLQEDSTTNVSININTNNVHKFSQFQTMFMLDVQFGDHKKKTRMFGGLGFGFGVNTKATVNYDYSYVSAKLNEPDHIWYKRDTSGTYNAHIGNKIREDEFSKVDLMGQAELGVDIGNLVISAHYNGSFGNMLTDPRIGNYVTSYYGLRLAYIIGAKPDLWGY